MRKEIKLGEEVEVDYVCIIDEDIDPDPWMSEYECPGCGRTSECRTLTGSIQAIREVIPFVEKGDEVILKCDHCGRLFHIKKMDWFSDDMILEFIGISTGG